MKTEKEVEEFYFMAINISNLCYKKYCLSLTKVDFNIYSTWKRRAHTLGYVLEYTYEKIEEDFKK